MNVLVTGAAGLLGTELCRQLRASGNSVVGIDDLSRYFLLGEAGTRAQDANVQALRDVGVELITTHFESPTGLAQVAQVDVVVHAAAQVCHSRAGEKDNPFHDVGINILGTVQLLEQCRKQAKPILFISSAKIYGENPGPLIDESTPLGDQTHITFFGASKAAADLFAQMYARKYGLKVGILRPGCFTGPWALAAEAQNWLPWMVHCFKIRRPFTIFGDGLAVRDLLHVSDLADACRAWLEFPTTGVWNIGGGPKRALSVIQAFQRVERLLKTTTQREFAPPRAGDIRRLVMDSGAFEQAYGWKARVGLDFILKETCT